MTGNRQEKNGILFHLLTSNILFLFLLQVLTIGISLMQVRISAWMARGILSISAITTLAFLIVGIRGTNFSFSKRLCRWQIPFLVFIGIATLIYLILWIAGYIMPDLSYDGNFYHIPTLSMWDIRGYIHWANTKYLDNLINGYPKGAELIDYLLVKAFGNSFINTVNLIFLPIGVLGIAYLARSLGAGHLLSICVGVTFILIPVNINQSVTTYVDSAFASCAAGLVAMLIHMVKKTPRWGEILIFGAVLGLVLSIKSTGVALSGLAMLALIAVWCKDLFFSRSTLRKSQTSKANSEIVLKRMAMLMAIGFFALLGGGYWYIRNYILMGSPLYPVGLTLLGNTIFPGVSISEAIAQNSNTPIQLKGQSSLIRVLYTWTQGFTAWPVSIKSYDSRDSGLGFLWLLACVPSIIFALSTFHELKTYQKKNLLTATSIIGIAFLTTPMNWWARYTVWIYILGLPCLALTLTKTIFNRNVLPWIGRIVFVWMTLCVSLSLFEAAYCTVDIIALASPGPLRQNIKAAFKSDTWKWPTCYLFPDMQGTELEKILEQNGTVGIGPHGDMEYWRYIGLIGQLSQPIGDRHLLFISESPDKSEQEKLAKAKYIIWDDTVPLPSSLESRATSIAQAAGFLVLNFQQ